MRVIFLIPLAFILLGIPSRKNNCTKFHDGKFKIVNPNPKIGTTYITRKGNTQTEINNDFGYSVNLSVKWGNKCNYTLRLLKVLENRPNIPYDTTLIMTVQIVETKQNSYLQSTTTNKSDQVYQSEVFQIE
jgi:hypothetical protein